jgi:hypothetical protein
MFYTATLNGIPELFNGLDKGILMYIKFNGVLKKKRKETASENSYRKIQQDAIVYQNLLFHVYMKLNVFLATHRPSSGAKPVTASAVLGSR